MSEARYERLECCENLKYLRWVVSKRLPFHFFNSSFLEIMAKGNALGTHARSIVFGDCPLFHLDSEQRRFKLGINGYIRGYAGSYIIRSLGFQLLATLGGIFCRV